jgi:hypothetical protein
MRFWLLQKKTKISQMVNTSVEKLFGTKLGLNKDQIITPRKPNIKNLVTHFVNLKPKMSGTVRCPPSDDGIGIDDFSLERRCKKHLMR